MMRLEILLGEGEGDDDDDDDDDDDTSSRKRSSVTCCFADEFALSIEKKNQGQRSFSYI